MPMHSVTTGPNSRHIGHRREPVDLSCPQSWLPKHKLFFFIYFLNKSYDKRTLNVATLQVNVRLIYVFAEGDFARNYQCVQTDRTLWSASIDFVHQFLQISFCLRNERIWLVVILYLDTFVTIFRID